ncbi:MAG: hypothetical protein ABI193_14885, partial [Minicystis sp.]
MRLILDRALFVPRSGREARELLTLLGTTADDIQPHAVLTDSVYVLGADNQETDTWLAARSPDESSAYRTILTQG